MEQSRLLTRDGRMDNLKGLLMMLVVLGHLLELFDGAATLWIYRVIYLFHMPAFVFCSGYFAHCSLKRLGRLAGLYAVVQTLYALPACLLGLFRLRGNPLTTPVWIVWYLFSLILWALTLPLFQVKRTQPLFLAASVVLALAAGFWDQVGYQFSLSRTLVLLPFFLAGRMAGDRSGAFLLTYRGKRNYIAIVLLALIAGGSALALWVFRKGVRTVWLYHSRSYAAGGYSPLIRVLLLLAGAAWTAFLVQIVPRSSLPILSKTGQNTLPIYLLHGLCVKGLEQIGLFDGRVEWDMPLAALCALGLCLLLSKIELPHIQLQKTPAG